MVERIVLPDGTPALVRPIRRDGGPVLVEALRRLSPQARYQRFLSAKGTLSESELNYLTGYDGVNHLELVLVVADAHGTERFPVAVAQCVRERDDPALAEVAIVVADEWQRRGVGTALFRSLARRAWEVGIRRWKALMLAQNAGARKLLERVGTKRSERPEGIGVVEVEYDLDAPPNDPGE